MTGELESREDREWPGALLARRTEEGMEPDDLLCLRNARSRTPLLDARSGRSISPHP